MNQSKSMVPYASATSGKKAREEIVRILKAFGCDNVGTTDDFADHIKGCTDADRAFVVCNLRDVISSLARLVHSCSRSFSRPLTVTQGLVGLIAALPFRTSSGPQRAENRAIGNPACFAPSGCAKLPNLLIVVN